MYFIPLTMKRINWCILIDFKFVKNVFRRTTTSGGSLQKVSSKCLEINGLGHDSV